MVVALNRKFSRQRELIYNQVKNYPVHPTADEVYTALRKEHPNLSMGTVYRNLNLLTETGMLIKIHIDNSPERFDARTDSHYHMLCERCGQVFDIECRVPEGIEERIREKHGYIITEVSLSLKGICGDCSKVKGA